MYHLRSNYNVKNFHNMSYASFTITENNKFSSYTAMCGEAEVYFNNIAVGTQYIFSQATSAKIHLRYNAEEVI